MTKAEGVQRVLRSYATPQQHPAQVTEAHAALLPFGNAWVDGLRWALRQDDVDLKLLALQLLQEHFDTADAKRVLPAVRALISEQEDRLVRVTAMNTLHILGDTSEQLGRQLTPRLESDDDFERLFAAANLWRLRRCDRAHCVLQREASREESPLARTAAALLEG